MPNLPRMMTASPSQLFQRPNMQPTMGNVALETERQAAADDRAAQGQEFNQNQQTLARQDRRSDRSEDKSIKAMDAMLKDPKNAQYYANAYGVPMTPEVQAMLAQPEKAQKIMEGYKLAKDMGIDRFEGGINKFTQAYVESNGDAIAAMDAVKGFRSIKEDQTATAGLFARAKAVNALRGGAGGKSSKIQWVPGSAGQYIDENGQVQTVPGYKQRQQGLDLGSLTGAPSPGATAPTAPTMSAPTGSGVPTMGPNPSQSVAPDGFSDDELKFLQHIGEADDGTD